MTNWVGIFLKRVGVEINWRWMTLGLALSAVSVWLGLPPLSSEYGEIPRLYVGTWQPKTSTATLETEFSFLEHHGILKFRVNVLSRVSDADIRNDSWRHRKFLVDVRMIFPAGTNCSASMENMPKGVATTIKQLDMVRSPPDHMYPDLAAFELKGTDEKARMICDVPLNPRHTTYSRRALKLVVANPPPDQFWSGFVRGTSNQLRLEAPDAQDVKIDGHGNIDAGRKFVQLSDGEQDTNWEWLDRQLEVYSGIRLWVSGALLGLAATAILEGIRRFLDGESTPNK